MLNTIGIIFLAVLPFILSGLVIFLMFATFLGNIAEKNYEFYKKYASFFLYWQSKKTYVLIFKIMTPVVTLLAFIISILLFFQATVPIIEDFF